MTRKYSLVVEGDASGYSAYVPELPTIAIAASSMEELARLAKEAIQLYLEEAGDPAPGAIIHEVEVE